MKKYTIFWLLIFFSVITSQLYSQRIQPELIAHYPFSGNTNDVSSSKLHGKVEGAVPGLDRFGNHGYAYEFDGIDDYIQIPVNINPDVLPVCTITMWVRSDSAGARAKVFSHDNNGFDRTIGIDDRDGGTGWSAFSGTGNILGHHTVADEWTFLAVVYNQIFVDGKTLGLVKLYVNDSLYQEAGKTGQGLEYVHIGSNPTSGQFFRGTIDDIRIYEGELSAKQITGFRDETNPLSGPDVLWTRTYGGVDNALGLSVYENKDKSFTVFSSTKNFSHRNNTLYFVDSQGSYISSTSIGGEISDYYINGYQASPNWGMFILGHIGNDYPKRPFSFIKKINTQGQLNWEKKIEDYSYIYKIVSVGSGQYGILALKTDSLTLGDNYNDVLTYIKIKSDGTILKEKNLFLGSRLGEDITLTRENQLMVVATEYGKKILNANRDTNLRLILLDTEGSVIWTKGYGVDSIMEQAQAVVQTDGGGFLVLARDLYRVDNTQLYHFDNQGKFIWKKNYYGCFETIKHMTNGNYAMLGEIISDNYIFGHGRKDVCINIINPNGKTLWSKAIGGKSDDWGTDIYETEDEGLIIAGTSESFSGAQTEIYMIRISGTEISTLPGAGVITPAEFQLGQNYPNPFNPSTTLQFSIPKSGFVTLSIYNSLGQRVAVLVEKELVAGKYQYQWNAGQLASGTYYYQLTSGEYNQVKKMLLIK